MLIQNTNLKDLFLVERNIFEDERGTFSRIYSESEILRTGSFTKPVQVNTSFSKQKGTLRGIHFQYPPYSEAKLVSCVTGSVWDVGVDLRPNSPTRFQWYGVELSPRNGLQLLVPQGFGHAFITLEANTTLVYMINQVYNLEYESGIRFDDPMIGVNWPLKPSVISDKDKSWPRLEERIEDLDKKFT